MLTRVEVLELGKARWFWFVAGLFCALLIAAGGIPNLLRSHSTAEEESMTSHSAAERIAVSAHLDAPAAKNKFFSAIPQTDAGEARILSRAKAQPVSPASVEAEAGRKIVRTSSLEMIVQHPREVANRISSEAESLGGYLVSEQAGEDSAVATLTVRVPAATFEQARTEIRKLGVRVESEKIDAEDVTREYVDQDASLRNLRAEEAQYLSILKQARTVKDMLAVSDQLSNVRGQIEMQQAEFNTLSQQIETVAITVSLRTEQEEQVLGLNWRPLYQLKLAVRDGLDSLGTYGETMMTILFDLPAILLWIATIVLTLIGGFKLLKWFARRCNWNPAAAPSQQ